MSQIEQAPLLPIPGDDLRLWASTLVQVLQVYLANSGALTLPIYDTSGRQILNEDGHYVYNAGGTAVIQPNVVEIDTDDLVDAAITTNKIANLAVDTDKLADLAVEAAKLANLSVEAQHIVDAAVGSAAIAAAAIGSAHIANAAIISALIGDLAVTDAKILNINANKIIAGTITADLFESTLYGDLSQAMEYVKTILGAGDEYLNVLDQSELDGATKNSVESTSHADVSVPTLRLITDDYWDDGATTWDSAATWDIPVATSGDATLTVNMGASFTLMLAFLFTVNDGFDSGESIVIKAQYSTDGANYGTNRPALDDSTWETLSLQSLGAYTYLGRSGLYTFQYYKIKIEFTSSSGTQIILRDTQVQGNVVNLVAYFENETIGASGTSFSLTGFTGTPGVTVTPVGTTPLIPTVSGMSSSGFTVHLYNTSGTEVGGTANMIAIGV